MDRITKHRECDERASVLEVMDLLDHPRIIKLGLLADVLDLEFRGSSRVEVLSDHVTVHVVGLSVQRAKFGNRSWSLIC